MKKWFSFFLMITLLLTGCAKQNGKEEQNTRKTENDITIYYLDLENNKLVEEVYTLKRKDLDGQLREVIAKMSNSDSIHKMSPIRKEIFEGYTVSKFYLKLKFQENYYNMDASTEILCRAAIVKSFTQLQGIKNVMIYVDERPLINRKGEEVGILNERSFVDNNEGTYYGETFLYFSNVYGNKLRMYPVLLESSDSASIEQVIIQKLLEGPNREGYLRTMPEGTTLISVSVKDGVCYVDFNDKFLNKVEDVNSDITIYSIVNSLVELSNVNKVQFTINGEKIEKYQDSIPFDGLFERNYDMIDMD
ncbi:MAG: GerMN domain-containing protein [Lachnospiraceae bacterium]